MKLSTEDPFENFMLLAMVTALLGLLVGGSISLVVIAAVEWLVPYLGGDEAMKLPTKELWGDLALLCFAVVFAVAGAALSCVTMASVEQALTWIGWWEQ